jgi:hypothetical protein
LDAEACLPVGLDAFEDAEGRTLLDGAVEVSRTHSREYQERKHRAGVAGGLCRPTVPHTHAMEKRFCPRWGGE